METNQIMFNYNHISKEYNRIVSAFNNRYNTSYTVKLEWRDKNSHAQVDHNKQVISINRTIAVTKMGLVAVYHELQHAIQLHNDPYAFVNYIKPEDDFEAYQNQWVEVDAREQGEYRAEARAQLIMKIHADKCFKKSIDKAVEVYYRQGATFIMSNKGVDTELFDPIGKVADLRAQGYKLSMKYIAKGTYQLITI